jgi:hypothetical protein
MIKKLFPGEKVANSFISSRVKSGEDLVWGMLTLSDVREASLVTRTRLGNTLPVVD